MAQYADSDHSGSSNHWVPDSGPTGGGSSWHKTSTLSDGTPIGRLGAYWYILDEDGYAISDGYHEIFLDEDGDYRGKRSTRTERIVLQSEPEQASPPSSEGTRS